MVTTKLNLSMTEPQVRQIYAKQGDTGRVLDISLDQTPEDGTLRILRPDGVEVTSEAVTGGEVESGSTFESLTEADVTELTVGIEPVQDLSNGDPSPSNICPITGHDDVRVTRTGKNLLDKANVLQDLFIKIGTMKIGTIGSTGASVYCPIKGGETYTVSKIASARFTIATTTDLPANNVSINDYRTNNSATSLTIQTTENDKYIVAFVYLASADTGKTQQEIVDSVQVEQGSTATTYEPYQGSTYTTPLGQTVYGGTLDMVSGVLTVDKGFYTVTDVSEILGNGSKVGTYPKWLLAINSPPNVDPSYYGQFWDRQDAVICNMGIMVRESVSLNTDETTMSVYFHANNMEIRLRPLESDFPTLEEAKQAYVGAEFVYPVIPTTYQLTAQQIKTLVGANNVWASSGDIVNITFTYGGLLSELPSEATEIVGKCYCDVEQNGVSSMPFTLNVKKNERES